MLTRVAATAYTSGGHHGIDRHGSLDTSAAAWIPLLIESLVGLLPNGINRRITWKTVGTVCSPNNELTEAKIFSLESEKGWARWSEEEAFNPLLK